MGVCAYTGVRMCTFVPRAHACTHVPCACTYACTNVRRACVYVFSPAGWHAHNLHRVHTRVGEVLKKPILGGEPPLLPQTSYAGVAKEPGCDPAAAGGSLLLRPCIHQGWLCSACVQCEQREEPEGRGGKKDGGSLIECM